MRRIVAFALVGCSAFGSGAQAADFVTTPPVAAVLAPSVSAATVNWTGFHFGVQGAYVGAAGVWTNTEFDERSATANFSGPSVGVRAGFDFQFGHVVLGVSADYNFANIEGNGDFVDDTDSFAIVLSSFGGLDARVGVPIGRFLPYVIGGLAWANSSHTYFSPNVNPPSESFGTSKYWGWEAGIGVDLMLTDAIVARVEYRHSNYGNVAYEPTGPGPTNQDHEIALTNNWILGGISIKF